jgi:hypothetical protein
MYLPVPKLCPGCNEIFDLGEFKEGRRRLTRCKRCRLLEQRKQVDRAIAALDRIRDARRARIRASRACAGE